VHDEKRNTSRFIIERLQGRGAIRSCRPRAGENNEIILKEKRCQGVDQLLHLAQHMDKAGLTLLPQMVRIFFLISEMVNEVTGDWRKVHNEEPHNLYSSPSIIRVIKPRRMRWVGHVARMGEKRNAYRILVGKPEETTGKTTT
jgi:hypothetical protein